MQARVFRCVDTKPPHDCGPIVFQTEDEYDKEVKAVADCLNMFELSAGEVEALIKEEKGRPGTGAGGYTANRGFDVVRIKLPVDAEGF